MTRDPQSVLRERARALAAADDREADAGASTDVLSWQRGAHWFAVPLAEVRAIAQADRLAAVPHAAPPLVGVIAVRGTLIPVYDPLPLLGPARAPITTAPWAVVVEAASPFGLLSDAIPVAAVVDAADLRPPAGDLPSEARRCLEGVDVRGRALLSAGALRSDPRLTLSPDPHRSEHPHHDD